MANNLKPLLYFVKEREAIRLKRESGKEAPWTKDPILGKFRFCNVRRSHDRVSQWLIQNVLTQANIDFDLESFLMFSAWARTINWPPTIKFVMDEGLYPRKKLDWAQIGRAVDHLSKTEKAWTGAFMVRAPKRKGAKKGKFVSEVVIGKNFKKALPGLVASFRSIGGQVSYQELWEHIQTVDGFGSFMSGQVVGDWTYTSLLSGAPDLKTWAPMGPGSVRGFNRIIGNEKLNKRPDESLWQEKLIEWRQKIIDKLGPEYEDMTALDVQNINCEWDKYSRVKNGEGRPRARYTPHNY